MQKKMKKSIIHLVVLTGALLPSQILAQAAKNNTPPHTIQYVVDGVETAGQAKKLNEELLMKKGVLESDFDMQKHLLTVKANPEIEEKHVFKAIIVAGFKPIEAIR
jgi:hypothetical protein